MSITESLINQKPRRPRARTDLVWVNLSTATLPPMIDGAGLGAGSTPGLFPAASSPVTAAHSSGNSASLAAAVACIVNATRNYRENNNM